MRTAFVQPAMRVWLHHLKAFSPAVDNPGRGWVAVRAPALTAAAILDALELGDFYASTGVEIEQIARDGAQLSVAIRARQPFRFTTTLIGEGGHQLKTDVDNPARCELTGRELYVRAKVVGSNGDVAWTQPVVVQPDRFSRTEVRR